MRKLILLLLFVCGCNRAQVHVHEHRVPVPISEIPAKDLEIAQEKFPEVKFDTALKLDSGAIELRGKNQIGKIHEVEFSAAGDIVETN